MTVPRPNFLTGSPLDRRDDLRQEADAFERVLSQASHLIVPVRDAENLVQGDDPVHATFVGGERARELLVDSPTVALLGEAEERFYWLADVDGDLGARLEAEHAARFTNLRSVSALLVPGAGAILVHARALSHFHNTHRFCGRCGSDLISAGLGSWRRCSDGDCRHTAFPRTDPAIIVRLARDDRCLLVRQPGWRPRQFATVAGFVEPGESLEEAVIREVKEEVGLDVVRVRYHSSQPWPFPSSIMIGFDAEVRGEIDLRTHEIEEARWFTRDEMRAAEANGEIRLPSPFSISRRLIEDWLEEAR
jgi:NAD+ diphosphatase